MRFIYLVIATLFIGLLIFVHEMGHFIVAKFFGMKVNAFSIGMGKCIWHRQKGETDYRLCLLPVGGSCMLEGEDMDTGDPRCFLNQSGFRKFLVLFAGPFMNFLAGLLLVGVMMMTVENHGTPTIDGFMDGVPYIGDEGLLPGDVLLNVNGRDVVWVDDVTKGLDDGNGHSVIELERDGEVITRSFDIERREYEYEGETAMRYGLLFELTEPTLRSRIHYGWNAFLEFNSNVLRGLKVMISGKAGISDMSGVVGVVAATSDVATDGFEEKGFFSGLGNIVSLMAFLSVNLAIMNLLPIPALDGGRIMFLVIDGILVLCHRKKMDPKVQEAINGGTLLALMLLLLIVTLKDVASVFIRLM